MVGVEPQSEKNFENRKADHIRLALDQASQTEHLSGLSRIRLIHEALPELNWSEISLETSLLGEKRASPFFVSSMTAGHALGEVFNSRIAEAAQEREWVMGIGSQRKQLFDQGAVREWQRFRKSFPRLKVMGNIGLSQLIEISNDDVKALAESVEASAMIVHTNPLQEAIQPEGTPHFRGGLKRIEDLVRQNHLPVILKETGCGFSKRTLLRLKGLGLKAVDISGLGGTHWGRIEGFRSSTNIVRAEGAEVFKDWGIPTVDSLRWAQEVKPEYEVWASGGVRSGLDAAKMLSLGARAVGFAQPLMVAAQESAEAVAQVMEQFEYQLKLAMFCTGSRGVHELRNHIEVRDEPRN